MLTIIQNKETTDPWNNPNLYQLTYILLWLYSQHNQFWVKLLLQLDMLDQDASLIGPSNEVALSAGIDRENFLHASVYIKSTRMISSSVQLLHLVGCLGSITITFIPLSAWSSLNFTNLAEHRFMSQKLLFTISLPLEYTNQRWHPEPLPCCNVPSILLMHRSIELESLNCFIIPDPTPNVLKIMGVFCCTLQMIWYFGVWWFLVPVSGWWGHQKSHLGFNLFSQINIRDWHLKSASEIYKGF